MSVDLNNDIPAGERLARYSATPLYYQLAERLRTDIASGRLPPGSLLPTEEELCRRHSLSRVTIRSALRKLEIEGCVRRVKSKGTFVSDTALSREAELLQTAQDFLSSGDNLLAKRISEELKEEINLQTFLGNGSSKIMEYSPAKTLVIYSQGSQVIIEGKGKTYLVETSFPQLIVRQELSTKFIVQVKKENDKIVISVSG